MEYTKEVGLAIKESKEIAIKIKSNKIRPEHLFLALINNEESLIIIPVSSVVVRAIALDPEITGASLTAATLTVAIWL